MTLEGVDHESRQGHRAPASLRLRGEDDSPAPGDLLGLVSDADLGVEQVEVHPPKAK